MNAAIALGLTWLAILLPVVGVGLVVTKALQKVVVGQPRDFLSIWIGYSIWLGLLVYVIFLQIWYLFAPLNWIPAMLFAFVGWGSIALNIWKVRRTLLLHLHVTRRLIFVLLLGALATAWVGLSSAVPVTMPDFFGYELSIIQWAQENRALPGIANFEERIGFGSALWLLAASFDFGYWQGFGYVLPNGLFVTALVVQTAVAWVRESRRDISAYQFFLALALVVVMVRLSINPDWWLAAPQPDLPVLILLLVSASFLILFFVENKVSALQVSLLVSLLAVLVRVTAVPWFVMICLLAGGIALKNIYTLGFRDTLKNWTPSLVAIPVAAASYVLSRYFLTGYPLYPMTGISFGSPDWRLSTPSAAETIRWFFSRNLSISEAQIEDGSWFPIFLKYLVTSDTAVQGTILMLFLAFILFVFRGVRRSGGQTVGLAMAVLIGFSIVGLALWLWASKQERFAWPYLAILGLSPLTFVLAKYRLRLPVLAVGVGAVSILGLSILFFAEPLQRAAGIEIFGKPKTFKIDLRAKGSGPFGIAGLPKVVYKKITNSSGLEFSVPVSGESEIGGPGSAGGYCGLGLPECSFNEGLRLQRRADSFLGGFKLY